jgi:type VI secretion system secreted protein Hcp
MLLSPDLVITNDLHLPTRELVNVKGSRPIDHGGSFSPSPPRFGASAALVLCQRRTTAKASRNQLFSLENVMNLFNRWFGVKKTVKARKAIGSRAQLKVEALEDRCLAAVDAFIWFESPGVSMPPRGETKDAVYQQSKAFEIKDFSFGVENPTTIGSATGGLGAGKIKFDEFHINKTSDKASPLFFKNCAAGSHYDKIIIELCNAGGNPPTAGTGFLQFKFDTVFTTKINWSGPGDPGPQESINFVYGQLNVNYFPSNPPPSK